MLKVHYLHFLNYRWCWLKPNPGDFLLRFPPFRFYAQFTEPRPCPKPFRFSDKPFSDADFIKWLFLNTSYLPSMPLQDAGQLLPATRPEADSFSFTEEDFPPQPSPLRHAPVLQWRGPGRTGSRLARGWLFPPCPCPGNRLLFHHGKFPRIPDHL